MIILKVIKLSGFLDKCLGLLKYDKPEAVYFTTRFGIHTFGMKYPIDVLICDNNWIVREMKENLKPNRIFFWNPCYDKVIEFPPGAIKEKNIKKGETIEIP